MLDRLRFPEPEDEGEDMFELVSRQGTSRQDIDRILGISESGEDGEPDVFGSSHPYRCNLNNISEQLDEEDAIEG